MTGESTSRRGVGYYCELVLTLLVILSIIYTARFLYVEGYVPQPYLYGSQAAQYDYEETAFFAHNPGAYTNWLTVYPPLSFIFLRVFSIKQCYMAYGDISASRECDWLGAAALWGFFFVNILIAFLVFNKIDKRTAWMRTIATALGLPCLYAMERGNLIIPTFTVFMLGHGRILRSAWMRWLFVGLAINFKPYLILTIIGHFFRRRWRWLEGCAIVSLLIYLVTYVMYGDGNPIQLLSNIALFTTTDAQGLFERSIYSSSYVPVMQLIHSNFPLMHFVGSRLIEYLEFGVPLAVNIGKVGIALCLGLAMLRPYAVPISRLAAIAVSWVLISSDPSGYAVMFLFFLVFMEPWRRPLIIFSLVLCYISCLSYDIMAFTITHQLIHSYLTNREVGYDMGVSVGILLRPAMIILITYALILASLVDLFRAFPRPGLAADGALDHDWVAPAA